MMGTRGTVGDFFGDADPQDAVSLPSAVGDYVTEGLDPSGIETRIAEAPSKAVED